MFTRRVFPQPAKVAEGPKGTISNSNRENALSPRLEFHSMQFIYMLPKEYGIDPSESEMTCCYSNIVDILEQMDPPSLSVCLTLCLLKIVISRVPINAPLPLK